MTNSVYDHLVGHEVTYALWTPTQAWGDFVGEGSHATMRHVILNVVEDARIERMIKDKFPGLKRDFANAYAQYATDDLFKIAGKDVNDLSILDRINLHFKLGIHTMMDVSFTSEEMVLVNACATTKTFDDVVEVSEKIFDLLKQEQEEKENEQGDDSEQGDESQGDSAQHPVTIHPTPNKATSPIPNTVRVKIPRVKALWILLRKMIPTTVLLLRVKR